MDGHSIVTVRDLSETYTATELAEEVLTLREANKELNDKNYRLTRALREIARGEWLLEGCIKRANQELS